MPDRRDAAGVPQRRGQLPDGELPDTTHDARAGAVDVADALNVKLDGFSDLERYARGLPDKLNRRVIRKTLRRTGNKQKKRLKAGTPRRTGAGAKQINLNVRVRPHFASAQLRYKFRASLYLKVFDQGGKRQPKRPFFERALAGWEGQSMRDFQEELRRVLRETA